MEGPAGGHVGCHVLRRPPLILLLVLSACENEPPPPPPPPVDALTLGYRAAHAGDHGAAVGHFEMATEAQPEESEAWTGLARAQLRADQPIAAMLSAQQAVALAGESADAHELLGLASLAAATSDGDASASPSRPRAAPSIDRAARAAIALNRALALAPDRVRIHFALGRAHELAGQNEEASAAYRASAEAQVWPARSRIAAVRTQLDALVELTEEVATELRAELDAADVLATDDARVRAAAEAQRRRIARRLQRRARPAQGGAPLERELPGILGLDPAALEWMLQNQQANGAFRGGLPAPETLEELSRRGAGERPGSGQAGGRTIGALVQQP